MIKSRYRSLGKSPGQPTTGGKNAECPWRCQCFLRCPALTLLGRLPAARLCRGTCFSSLSAARKRERGKKKKCISEPTFPLSSPFSERRQVSLWFLEDDCRTAASRGLGQLLSGAGALSCRPGPPGPCSSPPRCWVVLAALCAQGRALLHPLPV